jgi:2-oxoisovalerate dehydrogenase E1 component subunit alpha
MGALVQLLNPAGECVEHPDYKVELTAEQMLQAYRDLVIVRRIDSEAIALARQGELAIWASLRGQEAAQIGSGRALAAGDMAFPAYREHGVAWCRGIDPLRLLTLFRGVDYGGWDPADANFQLYSIVVGGHVLHATGYAMGIQLAHRDDAAIVYFGDGAMSQGDVSEAFGWAAVFNAPIVFFCQNNQWAISQPVDRQSAAPLSQRAHGFGFAGVQVDGNDVLACHAVTKRALEDARSGQGPTLVEAYTYRMEAHTTTDDPTRYRPAAELAEWQLKDPIDRLRLHLLSSGLADDDFIALVEAEASDIGADLRRRCLATPEPVPAAIFENVYAAPHSLLAEEREQFLAYLASFQECI